MDAEITEVAAIDSRGSKVGMFSKIYRPMLATRPRGWGDHRPMRIRQRKRGGPRRESQGFIACLSGLLPKSSNEFPGEWIRPAA